MGSDIAAEPAAAGQFGTGQFGTGLADALAAISAVQAAERGALLVAVDGPGGAGKSTFAAALACALAAGGRSAALVPLDDFLVKERSFDDSWERSWDRARLVDEVLAPLRRGEPVAWRRLEWWSNTLSDPIVLPAAEVVVVEGITALHPALRRWWDLAIWLEVPIELAAARGLARDIAAGHEHDWPRWAANDRRYRAEHDPVAAADLVLTPSAAAG